MKVMIVVTHLLGIGHLSRALTLARAFEAAGHVPLVVTGGMPAPHLQSGPVRVVQLPSLRSDGVDFTRLLDENGDTAPAALLAHRQSQLLDTVHAEAPDVLITELFPFGRRILKDEFHALLAAAHALPQRPKILASIRDILAPPSKPKKVVFAEETITQYYDAVLVHADPAITPLDLSWPVGDILRPVLRYTGFVSAPAALPHPQETGKDEIIVSAGGGDVGSDLFACAMEAAATDPDRVWRVLVGGANAQDRVEVFAQNAPANLIVEPARPDFRQMLHHAAASVSMCGYNTAQDILQTGCPAVFVPFDAGNEVEQSIRAKALQQLSGIEVVAAASMTPSVLLNRIGAVTAAPTRAKPAPAGGANMTVRIVEDMCSAAL